MEYLVAMEISKYLHLIDFLTSYISSPWYHVTSHKTVYHNMIELHLTEKN